MDTTPITAGVIQGIAAAQVLVGDAVKPEGGGWQGAIGSSPYRPYAIVEETGGGGMRGSLSRIPDDPVMVYQIRCFGASRIQASSARDAVRAVMLSQNLTFAGYRLLRVSMDVPLGTIRDDDTRPHYEFYAADRFRVRVT